MRMSASGAGPPRAVYELQLSFMDASVAWIAVVWLPATAAQSTCSTTVPLVAAAPDKQMTAKVIAGRECMLAREQPLEIQYLLHM